ncbi:hypothetical protein NDU88_007054, partial [Pleurodeles waltl]
DGEKLPSHWGESDCFSAPGRYLRQPGRGGEDEWDPGRSAMQAQDRGLGAAGRSHLSWAYSNTLRSHPRLLRGKKIS